jgi:hypothetical protein
MSENNLRRTKRDRERKELILIKQIRDFELNTHEIHVGKIGEGEDSSKPPSGSTTSVNQGREERRARKRKRDLRSSFGPIQGAGFRPDGARRSEGQKNDGRAEESSEGKGGEDEGVAERERGRRRIERALKGSGYLADGARVSFA